MIKIPDSELELMLIIWDAKEAVSRNYIQEHLKKSKNLAPTTILSLLSRLEKKQFVKVERIGKNNYYYPIVNQEEYAQNETRTVLERFFGNSIKDFVVQLNDAKAVEQSQIEELREFLNSLPLEDTKNDT